MIRTVIADDEQPARSRMVKFLRDYPDFTVEALTETGEETAREVNRLRPDVLFLDIQMPKGSGFDALLQMDHKPIIIFTTAYDEYAIDAFEVHAVDYLLKPFSKVRFSRTVAQIRKLLENPADHGHRVDAAIENILDAEDFLTRISIKKGHVYTVVSVDAIDCIKTQDGLVFVQITNAEYQTDITLSQFEKRLDPRRFMRIHRKAIVNLEKIEEVVPWGQGRYAVRLQSGSRLHISRDKIKKFRKVVGLKV
ncbi:MAG: LytTR family DNA-binding domain-containing protein [Spirochaetaceae bacterium]|nr:LytTR family DNA-binding domain-containing protein [Spirochaetaceae bacterium]MDT8296668.1 LytTR family DNA-binding domain-containing protein [Spirochaetaceae bacterium]